MSLEVAKTIKSQIIAADPLALMSYGARNFCGADMNKENYGWLSFTISNTRVYAQPVTVKISLQFNDTYTVEVFRTRVGKVKLLNKKEDVYFNELVEVLDAFLEGK